MQEYAERWLTCCDVELDALGEDFEEESLGIPSYLQQGTDALPDFIDEPPVAEHTIVCLIFALPSLSLLFPLSIVHDWKRIC